ncbi:UPF0223 family protein [Carnobacteriaceae bacterium zg-ZUI240]|nr:UPF0223 family protein [Carnobacteriaceae bacterium zg-ZUI240]
MTKNYEYPIDYTWSHTEMTKVITLFNAVEKAYETGILKADFLKAYADFKTVITSIGEEKRIGREFENVSGYVLYKVVQRAKNNDGKSKIYLGE